METGSSRSAAVLYSPCMMRGNFSRNALPAAIRLSTSLPLRLKMMQEFFFHILLFKVSCG
jgi:hypothetical protein